MLLTDIYAERIMSSNLKTILAEIPRGSDYKLTADGRILKNQQPGIQPDEQSDVSEDKQELSRANTQGNQDSQNAIWSPLMKNNECNNFMESGNHESSALQYGHPEY